VNASWIPFVTPVGLCGIAWSDAGITGLQLPEGSETALHTRMTTRFGARRADAATALAQEATDALGALLRGESADLAALTLDMTGVPPFHQRVYIVARRIPPGRTLTYGDVADRLGSRGLSRAVGQALGRNPFAIIVPCHRVVSASGGLGGFSAHTGVTLKERLLEIEGWKRLTRKAHLR
jgi:methylated-DNA-[protein]-cysteine S-methyltransferase